MRIMLGMLGDARELPRRFWQVYWIALVATLCVGFATDFNGWNVFSVAVYVLVGWIVFMSLMIVYRLGMMRAYNDAADWINDSMEHGDADLLIVRDKLGTTAQHFQGPS
jgi:hypothetical protein